MSQLERRRALIQMPIDERPWTHNAFARQIDRLSTALQDADAVLIGAGAELSTAAGLTYSGERFAKHFPDFSVKYGIRDMEVEQESEAAQKKRRTAQARKGRAGKAAPAGCPSPTGGHAFLNG